MVEPLWRRVADSAVQRIPYPARAWLKGIRGAYVRAVHRFSPADLALALTGLGIGEGDVVLVHSSFNRFEGFRGTPADVIRTLQSAVGESGTLLMPTLPFGGSAVEYANTKPSFDVRRTLSRMGLLTEVFRRSSGVLRSLHPTHSVAAWGAKAGQMIAGHERAGTPCGRETPYGRLLDFNGKILFIGVPFDTMTFFHAVEESLAGELPFPVFEESDYAMPYRDEAGVDHVATTRLFSARLAGHRDIAPLIAELRRRGVVRATKVALLHLAVVRAPDVLDAATSLTRSGVPLHHP